MICTLGHDKKRGRWISLLQILETNAKLPHQDSHHGAHDEDQGRRQSGAGTLFGETSENAGKALIAEGDVLLDRCVDARLGDVEADQVVGDVEEHVGGIIETFEA